MTPKYGGSVSKQTETPAETKEGHSWGQRD
jgi:hypothetical protein